MAVKSAVLPDLLIVIAASPALADTKHFVDAEADIDYRPEFEPLSTDHGTRVLTGRYYKTIYTNGRG